jgi:hypothetical protein
MKRDVQIAAGTELDQAHAIAAAEFVAHLHEGDDAPGQNAGDEADADFFAWRFGGGKTEQNVFVVQARFGLEGAEELAGSALEKDDLARHGRVLNVDINDGQKGGDAVAGAAHELRFADLFDGVHLAVSGRDDQAGAGWRIGRRVAKKINREEGEEQPKGSQDQNDDEANQGKKARPLGQKMHESRNAAGAQRQRQRSEDYSDGGTARNASMFH